jgi:hypothetical protein
MDCFIIMDFGGINSISVFSGYNAGEGGCAVYYLWFCLHRAFWNTRSRSLDDSRKEADAFKLGNHKKQVRY